MTIEFGQRGPSSSEASRFDRLQFADGLMRVDIMSTKHTSTHVNVSIDDCRYEVRYASVAEGFWQCNPMLWFDRKGEPIREFRKPWAKACTKAGISRLFHDLRRSACRNTIAPGVAQVTAMQVSGHKTDSMFRRYAIRETDLRTALRATRAHLAAARENVVAMAANGQQRGVFLISSRIEVCQERC